VKVIKDALGTGPLAEAAAHSLEIAGGPVTTVPVGASVAGVAGDPKAEMRRLIAAGEGK